MFFLLFLLFYFFFYDTLWWAGRAKKKCDDEYELSIKEFAIHLDTWGLLPKWSAKNLPTKGMTVFEYSPKHNLDPANNNPGWGEYVALIEDLGLDLGVRCQDTNEKMKLDRDTWRRAPVQGDIIFGVFNYPMQLHGYDNERNMVVLKRLPKNKKKKQTNRRAKKLSKDEHWDEVKKKVFAVWRAEENVKDKNGTQLQLIELKGRIELHAF